MVTGFADTDAVVVGTYSRNQGQAATLDIAH